MPKQPKTPFIRFKKHLYAPVNKGQIRQYFQTECKQEAEEFTDIGESISTFWYTMDPEKFKRFRELLDILEEQHRIYRTYLDGINIPESADPPLYTINGEK